MICHGSTRILRRTRLSSLILVLSLSFSFRCLTASSSTSSSSSSTIIPSSHTSNHAVIVSSSRFWFNYRHVINALSIYQLLKENGVPDSNIILMLADEFAVNPRNPIPNRLVIHHNNPPASSSGNSLYDSNTEIDYRGDDVRVEQLVRVLTGRGGGGGGGSNHNHHHHHPSEQPVLHTDSLSNILIYLTGHGGDLFFKFQDSEEILATQLASTLEQMHLAGKYHEILILADTCQAFTLGDKITSPNVTIIGSSLRGESSYAHHSDEVLGLSVIERYTHALIQFLHPPQDNNNKNKINKNNKQRRLDQLTLQQALVDPYTFESQRAHIGLKDDTAVRKANQVLMSDFFANVAALSNNKEEEEVTAAPTHLLPQQQRKEEQESRRAIKLWKDEDQTSNDDEEPFLFFSTATPSLERDIKVKADEPPECTASTSRNTTTTGNSHNVNDPEEIQSPSTWVMILQQRKYLDGWEPADGVFVALVSVLVGTTMVWSSL